MLKKVTDKKILVIAAHPDDEVLGCGATIAKHAQAGDRVWTLILGEGITARAGLSATAQKKMLKELHNTARRAANLTMGVKKLILEKLPDNRFDTVPLLKLAQLIEKVIEKFQPIVIYTHSHSDVNIDHRLTAEAVEAATRPMKGLAVKEVLSFEIPSSTEWNMAKAAFFRPNVFVEVSQTWPQKEKALRHYQSELRSFPHPRSLEYIDALTKIRGGQAGFPRAEAFQLNYHRRD